jgi:hypothetical protein
MSEFYNISWYDDDAEMVETEDDEFLDELERRGGKTALAAEMNHRFLLQYPLAKIRKGKIAKVCEDCKKMIPAGVNRMDYSEPRSKGVRVYWHNKCLPPQWFLKKYGWE